MDPSHELSCICGGKIHINNLLIGASSDTNLTFQELVERDWYHVTAHDSWKERILSANNGNSYYTHIGTEYAALERAGARFREEGLTEFYVYRVRFKPEQIFSPLIEEDLNDNFDDLNPQDSEYAAVFYKNKWEDVGSISAAANPHSLEFFESYKVTIDDLFDYDLMTLTDITDFAIALEENDLVLSRM